MNLVAKEFVVAQHATDGTGVLVLSEFTGAAEQLHEALACNPFDVEGLASTIERALELDEDERRQRLAHMATAVHAHDAFAWAQQETSTLELTRPQRSPRRTRETRPTRAATRRAERARPMGTFAGSRRHESRERSCSRPTPPPECEPS
jgi:trehalose-6-phosphate synthase